MHLCILVQATEIHRWGDEVEHYFINFIFFFNWRHTWKSILSETLTPQSTSFEHSMESVSFFGLLPYELYSKSRLRSTDLSVVFWEYVFVFIVNSKAAKQSFGKLEETFEMFLKKDREMLTCALRAHVNVLKMEITYWKLWQFISQTFDN